MSISSTVKKFMPYLKTAKDYVLYRLSSQAVEMDDGTTLEQKVTSLNSLISKKLNSANVVNNLTTTNSGYALDARQGKALNDSITSLNSALNDIASSDQMFFEKWIDGSMRYEVIVNFDDVEYDQLNRIPVLVGGNIGNTPFLYMYIADLPNLPQNASSLTGTAIIENPLSFYVAANKDGGESRRLRIVFANQSANGAHVYVEIKARGGKVQGETTSQIS